MSVLPIVFIKLIIVLLECWAEEYLTYTRVATFMVTNKRAIAWEKHTTIFRLLSDPSTYGWRSQGKLKVN